jgi:16S rRNA A1518/A1519 N6-dimethyltransferase RsmA/KsgA/DIM1 with predicted DNA glycosylase/AP lyase activity
VSASCFRPRPKISSAFICIEFSPETPDFSPFEYKLTMEIINYLFTMRRKKIFKVFSRFISEKGLIKGDSDNAAREILINAGIDSNLRPERIEWINFLEMARKYIEFAELAG